LAPLSNKSITAVKNNLGARREYFSAKNDWLTAMIKDGKICPDAITRGDATKLGEICIGPPLVGVQRDAIPLAVEDNGAVAIGADRVLRLENLAAARFDRRYRLVQAAVGV